ncbi:MAG: efflux RND transporter periplasmic adaptor subunit [Candidatus Sericytochromatia bacterium]
MRENNALKKNLLISLIILIVGLLAGFQIVTLKTTQAAPEGHGAEVPAPKTPRGPHTGRMFTDKDLTVEVQIYETEIPPEFHIWFWRDGKPVPLDEVKFSTKIYRLGKTDVITYKKEKDYLLSEQTIYEPHSFKAVFEGLYKGQHYQWSFSQEEGRVTVAPDLVKRSEIKILKAGPHTLAQKLSFPGQIALDQDKYVHIVSPVAGRAVEVRKHVGERVARGELLAVIHSRELSDLRLQRQLLAQKTERARFLLKREDVLSSNTRKLLRLLRQGQDPEAIHRQMMQAPVGESKSVLLSAFADLRLARQTLRREQQLQQDKVTSTEAVQMAHTEYDNALSRYIGAIEEVIWQRDSSLVLKRQDVQAAEAEQRALEQKLQVLQVPAGGTGLATARFEIRSPISGVVTDKHLAIGEMAGTDEHLFVIANLAVVWVELQVPDVQLTKVGPGQRVEVVSQDGQREASGVIAHTNPVVDPETRRVEAEVHIDNPDGYWRPGMFVNVDVTTSEHTVPVAVAKTALQSYNDWTVVYAKFGDTFEIRPLELGDEDEDWVEVKEGLPKGQAYAATNSFILKAEIGKKAATHDH